MSAKYYFGSFNLIDCAQARIWSDFEALRLFNLLDRLIVESTNSIETYYQQAFFIIIIIIYE